MPLFEKFRRMFCADRGRRPLPQKARAMRLEPLEERTLLTATPWTVSSFSDIQDAMASIASGGEIEIRVASDITLTGGQGVTISSGQSVTVTSVDHARLLGSGSVDRNCPLFSVQGGELILHSVWIDGLEAGTDYGSINGAVVNQTGGSVTVSGGTMISNCSAYNGGAFYVNVSGAADLAMTVVGGTITGCGAYNGGAVYVKKGTVNFSCDSNASTTAALIGNEAVGSGGAVYVSGSGVVNAVGSGSLKAQFHDNAAYNGGAFYAYRGSTLTLRSASLQGNTAGSNGGAVILAGGGSSLGTITVDSDTVILNNTAQHYGGAFSIAGGTVDISGTTTISSNKAEWGGAFYLNGENGSSSLTVGGGTVSGNSAERGGAAYLVGGASLYIGTENDGDDPADDSEVQFTNNSACYGGAVFAGDSSSVTMRSGTFRGNYVLAEQIPGEDYYYANGGAVYLIDSVMTVDHGTFSGNSADGDGGVFYLYGVSELTVGTAAGGVDDVRFTDNDASLRGGVLCIADDPNLSLPDGQYRSETVIFNGTFGGENGDGNRAGFGGVIGVIGDSHANITVHGGVFSYNRASGQENSGGGVFYVQAAGSHLLTIKNGCFGHNSSQSGGVIELAGAAAGSGNTVVIEQGTFEYNLACDGDGGVINNEQGTATVTIGKAGAGGAVSMAHNSAKKSNAATLFAGYGGAIYSVGTVALGKASFAGNSADFLGGALALQGANLVELSGTEADEKTFSGNCALNGGAIASSGSVTLNSAVFQGNYTTGGNGGAIDMISTSGTLTLGNCSFTNNSALGAGGTTGTGGVDWSQPELLQVGDGGAIQNWGTAVLSDCYFEGNSAHDGGGDRQRGPTEKRHDVLGVHDDLADRPRRGVRLRAGFQKQQGPLRRGGYQRGNLHARRERNGRYPLSGELFGPRRRGDLEHKQRRHRH